MAQEVQGGKIRKPRETQARLQYSQGLSQVFKRNHCIHDGVVSEVVIVCQWVAQFSVLFMELLPSTTIARQSSAHLVYTS